MKRALLLLSGGKDSRDCIFVLRLYGFEVTGLCVRGEQDEELEGALRSASYHNIRLDTVYSKNVDELSWNPFKVILKDLIMGYYAIKTARTLNCEYLATGVKKSDFKKLPWLRPFLWFAKGVLFLFGLKLIFPVWENE